MKNSFAAKAICQVSCNQLEEERIPWRLIEKMMRREKFLIKKQKIERMFGKKCALM